MILQGSTITNIGHARSMAAHLFKKENENVIVKETIDGGQSREAVENSLVEMQLYTRMTRGNTGIFSVAINPRENETLSPEEEAQAISMIETQFGLAGQTRIQVDHLKDGRRHSHLFWSLVDQEEGKLIGLNHYKRRLQSCADEMGREFGHEPTNRLPKDSTLEYTNADRMKDAELKKGKKEKALLAMERKKEIQEIWASTTTGQEFLDELQNRGYGVARGDRRTRHDSKPEKDTPEKTRFVLIDQEGQVSNLSRDLPRLIKRKDIAERFGELQYQLRNVEETRRIMEERNFYNQEQAEIDRQNKELDAMDLAGKQAAEMEKEALKKAQEVMHPKEPAKLPEKTWQKQLEKGRPHWSSLVPEQSDHLSRLDQEQELQKERDWLKVHKQKNIDNFYQPDAHKKRLEELTEKLKKQDNWWGRASGNYDKYKTDLGLEYKNYQDMLAKYGEATRQVDLDIQERFPDIPAPSTKPLTEPNIDTDQSRNFKEDIRKWDEDRKRDWDRDFGMEWEI